MKKDNNVVYLHTYKPTYMKKNWFFVKFGGKFFSAHLANSVSAYIFL